MVRFEFHIAALELDGHERADLGLAASLSRPDTLMHQTCAGIPTGLTMGIG